MGGFEPASGTSRLCSIHEHWAEMTDSSSVTSVSPSSVQEKMQHFCFEPG